MFKNYLKVMPSKTGNGVFTSVKIPKGSPIIEVTGDYFTYQTADHTHPALLQIGTNTYIGPSGDADDYINHSCNPNCYLHIVGKRAIIYSLYDIMPGNELTFDYSTTCTETDKQWKMECLCGDINCRKVISGWQYLPQNIIEDYKQKGILPLFITHPTFINADRGKI